MRETDNMPYCVEWTVHDPRTSSTLNCFQDCFRPSEIIALFQVLKCCEDVDPDNVTMKSPSGVIHQIDFDNIAEL